jgi:hypothetical protein
MKRIALFLFFSLGSTHCFDKLTLMTATLSGGSEAHAGVVNSVVRGLNQLGVHYNFNPRSMQDVGDVVVVLSNPPALIQAVEWKRIGRIKHLLAGPNLFVRPSEWNGLAKSPEIDAFIQPSSWPIDYWRELEPDIKINIAIWPAGVDETFWQPSNQDKSSNKNVLVYCKAESDGPKFYAQVEHHVRSHGWNPIRITYGSYNQQHYKSVLDQCRFAVFLSRSESQGLALAECWAMNVPTLVWNPGTAYIAGKATHTASAAPYLTAATGQFWKDFDEFDTRLQQFNSWYPQCTPRDWVLENMTDKVSAQLLLNLINKVEHR